MSQAGMNQRRYERFDIFERAAIIDASGQKTSVILVDVSLGGAQVLAKNPFAEGAECKLEVGQGADAQQISGVIRGNKPGAHDLTSIGFKLTAATGEERVAIATLVNRIFMNPTEMPSLPAKLIDTWLKAA